MQLFIPARGQLFLSFSSHLIGGLQFSKQDQGLILQAEGLQDVERMEEPLCHAGKAAWVTDSSTWEPLGEEDAGIFLESWSKHVLI